ncbi:uncharacterized protein [Physcomitrium patens]|nr:uncharacterized protein LOC112291333 isoform X2 [Physcomitrium patens]|eukprot:XP_024394352.1 uncharacterized protein LOC112291333 isoform X2 [Physcomitrella patens]
MLIFAILKLLFIFAMLLCSARILSSSVVSSEKAGGQGVSGCGVYKTSVPKMALGRGQSSNAKAVPAKRRRLSSNMKSGDTVGDIRKKFRGVAYRRRNGRYTVDVRWRGIKLCRECDSWEEGALIYDLAKLETKASKKPQKLNSDWDFLQAFILNNPFPDSLPLEKLKDAIVNKAVKAVKAWKMFLGDESFRKWSACGYAPEELAQTNEVIVDKNRCLQSENGYSVIKDEFERYKAGVEREKAETERRAAESNAFIDRILQNECKFILFDGNAAADTNDSRIGVTKKGLLAIHSFASLPENNSIDEMGDAEIEGLVLENKNFCNKISFLESELNRSESETVYDKLKCENHMKELQRLMDEIEPEESEAIAVRGRNIENDVEMAEETREQIGMIRELMLPMKAGLPSTAELLWRRTTPLMKWGMPKSRGWILDLRVP